MKSTTQKVRSLSLSGYLGSDLASGSVACCRHCCRYLILIFLMSYSGLVLLCVDFPCYCVTNSYTVLSMSCCCLVLILFSSDSFFFICCKRDHQYCNYVEMFLHQMYTNLAYVPPTYRRVKKLRVLMVNKTLRKSLASRNGNEIIILSWNDPVAV